MTKSNEKKINEMIADFFSCINYKFGSTLTVYVYACGELNEEVKFFDNYSEDDIRYYMDMKLKNAKESWNCKDSEVSFEYQTAYGIC